MLYAGLDLSRKRLEVCVLDEAGATVTTTWVPPTVEGLRELAAGLRAHGQPVTGVVESMTGGRFVHDQLELAGWEVELADAARAKALAPLAAKTDRIDARVLAELARRDLVPAVWLPDPEVRGHRERARFRQHLVHHRTALKNRVHSVLATFGVEVPMTDLFGVGGRELLGGLALPDAWADGIERCIRLIDVLGHEIGAIDAELAGVDHPDRALLMTAPGIGPVLGYLIASEVGGIERFASPKRLVGYTGLVPYVHQSGASDHRGPLTRLGPRYLRWALVEAATTACRHPRYAARHGRTVRRLGRQRGPKVARVEVARDLAVAIWHMLTRREPFRAAGPT